MKFFLKITKILFVLVVMVVLGGIIYFNRANYKVAYENFRVAVGIDKPCEKPITYSIGQFDTRFGQSRSQFIDSINTANAIWNTALNKKLLQYTEEKGDLTINLIFDNRQQSTDIMNGLDSQIENRTGSYDNLKADYSFLQNEYNNQKNNIEILSANYIVEKESYEKDVAYWNSHGGAPDGEFQAMQKRRTALNIEARNINDASAKLNVTINELNATAKDLNALSKEINQTVGAYNNVSKTNGPEFQEGEYIMDEKGQRINIYQYKDYAKLIRVLAHEFGHALGLDHVNDPKAIMYTYNMDTNMKLTAADISALKTVCGSVL